MQVIIKLFILCEERESNIDVEIVKKQLGGFYEEKDRRTYVK